jgi:uncharacterized membrane protein
MKAKRPKKPIQNLAFKAKITRKICLLSYGLAVLSFMASFVLSYGTDLRGVWVLGILLIPLLVFLPGLILANIYSQLGLCLMSSLYFSAAISHLDPPIFLPWFLILEAACFAILFTVCLYDVKYQGRLKSKTEINSAVQPN